MTVKCRQMFANDNKLPDPGLIYFKYIQAYICYCFYVTSYDLTIKLITLLTTWHESVINAAKMNNLWGFARNVLRTNADYTPKICKNAMQGIHKGKNVGTSSKNNHATNFFNCGTYEYTYLTVGQISYYNIWLTCISYKTGG